MKKIKSLSILMSVLAIVQTGGHSAVYAVNPDTNIERVDPRQKLREIEQAVEDDNADQLNLLLKGTDISSIKFEKGRTLSHLAAMKGKISVIFFLGDKEGINFSAKDDDGKTAVDLAEDNTVKEALSLYQGFYDNKLFGAVLENDLVKAKELISKGANVNQNNLGTPLLHSAVLNQNEDIVDLLIRNGAKINAKDSDSKMAIDHAENSVIKDFLNICQKMYDDQLCVAVLESDLVKAKELILKGANVNQNRSGQSLLHIAVLNQNEDLVNLLIKNEVQVDAKNDKDQTALHMAAFLGNEKLVKLLVSSGADVDAEDTDGKKASSFTINQELMDYLLLREKSVFLIDCLPKRGDRGFDQYIEFDEVEKECNQDIKNAIQSIVDEQIKNVNSRDSQLPMDLRKVEAIYSWIIGNINYTDKLKSEDNETYSEYLIRCLEDTFAQRGGVCLGKSLLFKIMTKMAGIPCVSIESKTHAFNAVYVKKSEGEEGWAIVDSTWGRLGSDDKREKLLIAEDPKESRKRRFFPAFYSRETSLQDDNRLMLNYGGNAYKITTINDISFNREGQVIRITSLGGTSKNLIIKDSMVESGEKIRICEGIESIKLYGDVEVDISCAYDLEEIDVENSTRYDFKGGVLRDKIKNKVQLSMKGFLSSIKENMIYMHPINSGNLLVITDEISNLNKKIFINPKIKNLKLCGNADIFIGDDSDSSLNSIDISQSTRYDVKDGKLYDITNQSNPREVIHSGEIQVIKNQEMFTVEPQIL